MPANGAGELVCPRRHALEISDQAEPGEEAADTEVVARGVSVYAGGT
jgi:hypothetical protein